MNKNDEWGVRLALLILHASIMLITLLAAFFLLACSSQVVVATVGPLDAGALRLEVEKGEAEESKAVLHIDRLDRLPAEHMPESVHYA